jgi:nucleoside-diphosphate-sugar epimerase
MGRSSPGQPPCEMKPHDARVKTALVTGANGYIGNAVARAFIRAGWITYGLLRSTSGAQSLAAEEILPVVGNIDDIGGHDEIKNQLPQALDAIISTTEDHNDYVRHYTAIISLLRTVGSRSVQNGVRPLVIFTSGCKDYGLGPHFANDPSLSAHTEESPINPPEFAALRAEYSRKIFEHDDLFSPVLVRPTNVHGRSSSFYGIFLRVASQAASEDKPLVMSSPADSIVHSMHVDDCGDAYVAIASHPQLEKVAGQVFNISARRYETVDEVARALVVEYGISKGLEYVDKKRLGEGEDPWPPGLIDFPQWTSSEKLRSMTGWRDHRPLFSDAIHVYRVAYEAAQSVGHENIDKVGKLLETALATGRWRRA